jgi:hypothetical protein
MFRIRMSLLPTHGSLPQIGQRDLIRHYQMRETGRMRLFASASEVSWKLRHIVTKGLHYLANATPKPPVISGLRALQPPYREITFLLPSRHKSLNIAELLDFLAGGNF